MSSVYYCNRLKFISSHHLSIEENFINMITVTIAMITKSMSQVKFYYYGMHSHEASFTDKTPSTSYKRNFWMWFKGILQKIKTENIMNLNQRVGRSRGQTTISNSAEKVTRVWNRGNKMLIFVYIRIKIQPVY